LEILGQLTHLSSELLDPEYQPVDQLLRDPVILLPAFDPEKPEFQMSQESEKALAEYVQRGGTLVVFPILPVGVPFDPIRQSSPTPGPAGSPVASESRYGSGRVFTISKDFSSWIDLDENFAFNASQPEFSQAASALRLILNEAGVRPAVTLEPDSQSTSDLVITELVSNEGTAALGERTSGQGMLSVTNLGDRAVNLNLQILSPAASSRFTTENKSEPDSDRRQILPSVFDVPARESLLLPLEQPLCSPAAAHDSCHDSVVVAGAELLSAEKSGNTLELTFYSPTRADARLRLEQKPTFVSLLENMPRVRWDGDLHELNLSVPRGPAPDYRRVVSLKLRYVPHVSEKKRPSPESPEDIDLHVLNAVPLNLGDSASLDSYPPLVVLDAGSEASLVLEAQNPFRTRGTSNSGLVNHDHSSDSKLASVPIPREPSVSFSVRLNGPLHGSSSMNMRKGLPVLNKMRLNWPPGEGQSNISSSAGPDGLVHEKMLLQSPSGDREIPIDFLIATPGGSNHYQFDFDRDGANEWVLENGALRIILSPESGGHALSLSDKSVDEDLISSVGAFRDGFSYSENPPGESSARERGRYGMFNRAYSAKWMQTGGGTALEMHYDARDVEPNGAAIDKTVLLDGTDAIRADYQVSLPTPASGAPFDHPQSFVVENSVAVSADRKDQPTRFCWLPPESNPPRNSATVKGSADDAALHCEPFVPGGKPLVVPAGVSRLEIHTLGRPNLAIEWSIGAMLVEQKQFSALLKLQFPPLIPGGPAGNYSVRLRRLPAE
jgi:hypothetical protein